MYSSTRRKSFLTLVLQIHVGNICILVFNYASLSILYISDYTELIRCSCARRVICNFGLMQCLRLVKASARNDAYRWKLSVADQIKTRQSQTANFAPCAPPGELYETNVVFDSATLALLCENMTKTGSRPA